MQMHVVVRIHMIQGESCIAKRFELSANLRFERCLRIPG